MLAPVCGPNGIWKNLDPSSPCSEDQQCPPGWLGPHFASLPGTPDTSWEYTPVLESLAKLLENMGKQDQLPLGRDVVQGNTPGLRDEQGWEWSPRVPAQQGGY